jgi:hypothetical protein
MISKVKKKAETKIMAAKLKASDKVNTLTKNSNLKIRKLLN